MLIGYGQPTTDLSWALTHSAVFLTSAEALSDGKPARVARVQWRPDLAPEPTHYVGVRAAWGGSTAVRIVALLGVNLPVGTMLALHGRRPIDASFTYVLGEDDLEHPVVQLPDGSRCAWWVLPEDNEPLNGLELRIYNRLLDTDLPSPIFDADSTVDLGEIVILQGAQIQIETSWSHRVIDPTQHSRSLGAQLASVARRTYREADVQIVPVGVAATRGGGLANGADLESIAASFAGDGRGAMITRYGSAEAIDTDEVHRTALYGRLIPGATAHTGGDYYAARWGFEEVPGP